MKIKKGNRPPGGERICFIRCYLQVCTLMWKRQRALM